MPAIVPDATPTRTIPVSASVVGNSTQHNRTTKIRGSIVIEFTVTILEPWSFFLSALIPVLIAISVWLAGNGNIMSWPLGIAAHVISGIYAFVSGDWGWLLAPLVVSPVFVRNWVKWHRQQRERQRQAAELALLPESRSVAVNGVPTTSRN